MNGSFRARRALRVLVGASLAGASLLVLQAPFEKSAYAQDAQYPTPDTLDPITIYATREAKRLLDVPQTVTVITRDELEKRMVRDIQDLVRYEPGVTVSKTTSSVDPFSNNAGFTIRGVSGNRVQMLVDGTRVIEAIGDGNRDFVNMSNLKAVEIIRGPAGVLWGADALGGIVAFTTKDPEDYLKGRNFGGQVGTYFDSYDKSFYKSAAVAARYGQFAALVNVSQRSFGEATLSKARADGGIYGCPRNPEAIRCNELNPLDGDDYDILGKLVWTPNAEHEVKLTGELVNKHSVVDQKHDLGAERSTATWAPTGNTILGYIRDQEQTRQRLSLSHRYAPNLGWIDTVRWQLSYSPQERDFTGIRHRRLANNQVQKLDYRNDWKEQFYEGDLQLNSSFNTLGALHKLTYGAYYSMAYSDINRRDLTTNLTTNVTTISNTDSFTNADTKRADFFIQDEMNFVGGRIQVTPGIRYATYELEPRASALYKPIPGKEPRTAQSEKLVSQLTTTIHWTEQYSSYVRYAEGFKMPTTLQLFNSNPGFGINGGSIVPNPDLKPEFARSYEIGLRGKLNDGFFSFSLFNTYYNNFIQSFVEQPSTTVPGAIDITYQNLDKVHLWGLEFAGEWRFYEKWSVGLTASWAQGTQKVNPAAPITPFNGSTSLTTVTSLRYFDPSTGIDAQLINTWADKVGPRSDPTFVRPSSYSVFDGIVQWKPKQAPGLTFNFAVLNILDARYFRSLNGATTYAFPTSLAVAALNPIELQTAPGRTYKVGASYEF